MTRTDRQILHIALPSIVSNITVPLLGLIDVSIVGTWEPHLTSVPLQWRHAVQYDLLVVRFPPHGNRGFTGYRPTADMTCREVTRILIRSLSISLLLALALLLLQYPIRNIAFMCMDTSKEVRNGYIAFPHLYLGAPATLGPLWLHGLVHRHAEFPLSDVHRHHPERC